MDRGSEDRRTQLLELPFEVEDGQAKNPFAAFGVAVLAIFRRRELLGLLVRRELKSKFKDSALGLVWTLVRPITLLLIYYVAIGQFLGAARGVPDFAIFVFAGLTLWGLNNELVAAGTQSIVSNSGLINFAIQFLVLVVATLVLGQFPISWDLIYAPVAVVIVLTYGIASALALSALNVYLRDIQYLVEVAMLVLFWASPIVYPWSFVVDTAQSTGLRWIENVYLLNPFSTALVAFQRAMWKGGSEERVTGVDSSGVDILVSPQPWPHDLDLRLLVTFLVGLLLLFVAQRIFSRLAGNFAQEL